MEKGKLLMEHTALGKLTKPFGHTWPVIRPNTWLLLAYKEGVRVPFERRKIIVKIL
jgi:hypothetical protein